MSIKTIYHFELLTGGSALALDSVDGNSLMDKDRSFTIVGDVLYVHQLDADSGLADNPPGVITPNSNAGTKRWILLGTRYIDAGLTFADLGTGFSLSGGTSLKTLSVPLNATLPGQDSGAAAPTTGTWPAGWIRWNTGRVAGGNVAWVCTVAGTPGTWIKWGVINADALPGWTFTDDLAVQGKITVEDVVTISPWVDVRAFGVITFGTGATAPQKTANAAVIQAAIASMPLTGGTIVLPPGTIYIDGDVVTLKSNVCLKGSGMGATVLYWDSGVCINASAGAAVISKPEVMNMTMMGQTTANKIGVRISDASVATVHKIRVNAQGSLSIGLQIRGRDMGTINKVIIYADKPISIEANPNSSQISIDHHHFSDCLLYSWDSTQAVVTLDSGIALSNVTFDGYQAWGWGKYGIYWNDTTSIGSSLNLVLKNVRWEGALANTGWMVYIKHNSSLINLVIENLFGTLSGVGGSPHGIYLRKIVHPEIRNSTVLVGTGRTYLDIDATCVTVILKNNTHYAPGTSVFSIGAGLEKVFHIPPSSAANGDVLTIYDTVSATNKNVMVNEFPMTGGLFTLVDTAVHVIHGIFTGFMFISDHVGHNAIVSLRGTADPELAANIDGVYSTIPNHADTINVYYENIPETVLKIQNLYGATYHFRVFIIGSSDWYVP